MIHMMKQKLEDICDISLSRIGEKTRLAEFISIHGDSIVCSDMFECVIVYIRLSELLKTRYISRAVKNVFEQFLDAVGTIGVNQDNVAVLLTWVVKGKDANGNIVDFVKSKDDTMEIHIILEPFEDFTAYAMSHLLVGMMALSKLVVDPYTLQVLEYSNSYECLVMYGLLPRRNGFRKLLEEVREKLQQ